MSLCLRQPVGRSVFGSNLGTTSYLGLGPGVASNAAGVTKFPIVTKGFFNDLKVQISVAPGSGKSRTFALYVNDVATALSVTIADSATFGSIDVKVEVNPGDYVYLKSTVSGSPANAGVRFLLWFNTDSAYKWQTFADGTTLFNNPSRNSFLWTASGYGTNWPWGAQALFAFRIKRFDVRIASNLPSGTATWTVYKNNIATSATVTISAGQDNGSWTGDVSVAFGDKLCVYCSRTTSSSIRAGLAWSAENNTEKFASLITNSDYPTLNTSGVFIPISTPGQTRNGSNTEASNQDPMPKGLSVRGIGVSAVNRLQLSYGPKRLDFVMRNNGADSGFSCSMMTAGANPWPDLFAINVDHANDFEVSADWDPICMSAPTFTGSGSGSVSHNTVWLSASYEAGAAPIISSMLPNTGKIGETLILVVAHGLHFTDNGGTIAVDLGAGITVDYWSDLSDTELELGFTIDPGATLGLRTLSVTNGDGVGTLPDGFTVVDLEIPAPTSVVPAYGSQGDVGDWLQVYGTNLTGVTSFDFGAGVTVVFAAVYYDFYAEVAVDIDAAATLGFRTVTATNPKGTGTLVDGFTVLPPLPAVTSVSPRYGSAGDTMTIHIFGTSLATTTDVDMGSDITVSSITVVSDTELEVEITIALAATIGLTYVGVTTTSGYSELTDGFLVIPFANVINSSSSCTVTALGSVGGFISGISTGGTPA